MEPPKVTGTRTGPPEAKWPPSVTVPNVRDGMLEREP